MGTYLSNSLAEQVVTCKLTSLEVHQIVTAYETFHDIVIIQKFRRASRKRSLSVEAQFHAVVSVGL